MGQNESGASRDLVLAAFGGTVSRQTGPRRPVSGQLHGAAGRQGRRHSDRPTDFAGRGRRSGGSGGWEEVKGR